MSSAIELGDLVRDKVTGFAGVVTGYYSFLSGCDQCRVQPRELSDKGNIQMTEQFDVLQLELVEKAVVVIDARPKSKRSGGPQSVVHRSN